MVTHYWSLTVVAVYICSTIAQPGPCQVYNEDFTCNATATDSPFTPWILQSAQDMNDEPLLDDCGTNPMEITLKLFAEGTEKIDTEFTKLNGNNEAILMIGNTGTGKSTLTFFIAGNDSAIYAYKSKLGEIQIRDCNDKIGQSLIASQTSFPEAVVDQATSTALFDYPGFLDTRPPCKEIANAYFMLNVAQRLDRAKIIIVIEYSAITGVKGAFGSTLKSVIDFIPNIDQLTSGIGLIATKVFKPYDTDTEVISYITIFLNGTLSDPELSQVFPDPNVLEKATFIINELLLGNGKIDIFRQPDNCGPLSTIPLMQSNSITLRKLLFDNVEFVDIKPSDFGYSLSDGAKLNIVDLRVLLSETITLALEIIRESVTDFLSYDCTEATSCTQTLQAIQMLHADEDFTNNYADFSSWSGSLIQDIVGNTTVVYFAIPGLTGLSPNVSEALLTNSGYLDILESMDKNNIALDLMYRPLRDLSYDITRNVPVLARSLGEKIESLLKEMTAKLLQNVFSSQPCDKIGCALLLNNLENLYANVDFTNNYAYPGEWTTISNQDILIRLFNFKIEGFEWGGNGLDTLKLYGEYLDTLVAVESSLVIPVDSWLQNMRNLKTLINNEINSKFLPSVYKHIRSAIGVVYATVLTIQVDSINALDDIFGVRWVIESLTQIITDYKKVIDDQFFTDKGLVASIFVEKTITNFKNLGLSNAESEFYKEFNPTLYFTFFEKNNFPTEIKQNQLVTWYKSLTNFEGLINDEKVWYNFLLDLLEDLAHRNTQTENVWKFKNWWDTNGAINANDDNVELKLFWSTLTNVPAITKLNVDNVISLLTTSQDRSQKFDTLNAMLESTLTDKLICFDVNRVRDCRGMFVSLKSVLSYQGLLADSEIESIVIKAYLSVYIDSELTGTIFNDGNNIDVYIISPVWIATEHSINLNGGIGSSESPIGGIGGAEGNPGGVGGNAGNLFGIGRFFPNAAPIIRVDGGVGGNGQAGQVGSNGTDGVTQPKCDGETYECFDHWDEYKIMRVTFNEKYMPCSCICDGPCMDMCSDSQCHVDCYIPPAQGTVGGPGGAGGQPGKGGLGGAYTLKIVEDDRDISQVGVTGADGGEGAGGAGGIGGLNGPEVWSFVYWNCESTDTEIIGIRNRQSNGQNGESGRSSISPTLPKEHYFDHNRLVPFYIDQYKTATQILLLSKFHKTPLTEFLNKVDQMTL